MVPIRNFELKDSYRGGAGIRGSREDVEAPEIVPKLSPLLEHRGRRRRQSSHRASSACPVGAAVVAGGGAGDTAITKNVSNQGGHGKEHLSFSLSTPLITCLCLLPTGPTGKPECEEDG